MFRIPAVRGRTSPPGSRARLRWSSAFLSLRRGAGTLAGDNLRSSLCLGAACKAVVVPRVILYLVELRPPFCFGSGKGLGLWVRVVLCLCWCTRAQGSPWVGKAVCGCSFAISCFGGSDVRLGSQEPPSRL